MKKKLLLFTLIPLLLLGPVSCTQNEGSGKVFLHFGKVYESKPEKVDEISYDEISTLIEGDFKQSFAFVLSNEGCTCWKTFEPILADFNYKYNLDIKHIDYTEFEKEGRNKYGLHIIGVETPSVAFFSNGNLIRQAIYRGASKDIFTDTTGKEFEKFFFENAVLPKMYYVARSTLDSYISTNKDFNLYVARSECGDCNTVNRTMINDWNKNVESVRNPLYIFDIQEYHPGRKPKKEEGESDEDYNAREDVIEYNRKNEIYQGVKDQYGLSEKNNPDLGFSTGAVPTFQHRIGNVIDDMAVILNDSLVSGTNNIVSSYFTAKRVSNMKFLEGTGTKYVLDGIALKNDEIGRWGYPDNSAQVERHRPILNLFLDKYTK